MKEREIKEELRYYSERYYAKPLSEAGFTNYRNDLLNWYCIYNGLICHFHIICVNSRFPMLMLIWWIQPTYLPTIINPPASWNRFRENLWFSTARALFPANTVEAGHLMNVPRLPQRGAERLEDELFPQMRRLNTREAVYSARKEQIFADWKKSNAERRWEFPESDTPIYVFLTPDFADSALIMNDTEMFPHCIDRLEKLAIPASRRFQQKDAVMDRSTEQLEAQLKALKGQDLEAYFELMKERKARFLKRYHLQDEFEL